MRTPAVWAMSLATPTKNPITVLDLCSRWVYRQCCDNAGPVPSSIREKVRKAANGPHKSSSKDRRIRHAITEQIVSGPAILYLPISREDPARFWAPVVRPLVQSRLSDTTLFAAPSATDGEGRGGGQGGRLGRHRRQHRAQDEWGDGRRAVGVGNDRVARGKAALGAWGLGRFHLVRKWPERSPQTGAGEAPGEVHSHGRRLIPTLRR